MSDDRRPPIEPLSEFEWQRVERRLFLQLDLDGSGPVQLPARRAWQPWAAGGAAALAAAAAVALWLAPAKAPAPATAPVATTTTPAPVAPSRVVTGDGASEVTFGDATITVAAASAVTMHGEAAEGVLIVLERGAATFEVAPRAGRPAFTVQAGEVLVRVVGTRFAVTRSGDTARVDVIEGDVEVVARGARALVHAGESWPKQVTAAPLSDADEQPLGGAPLVGGAGAVADETPRPRQRSSRDRYERAAALEARDPRAALGEYRTLARGKDAWAANALYAGGRLAAELGDRGVAVKMLRAYLQRFPRGGNVADARALLQSLGE